MAEENIRTYGAHSSTRGLIDWSKVYEHRKARENLELELAMAASRSANNEAAAAAAAQLQLPESSTRRPIPESFTWLPLPRADRPEPEQPPRNVCPWCPQPQHSNPIATPAMTDQPLLTVFSAPTVPLSFRRLQATTECSVYECPVCLGPVQTPVATKCGHVFCSQCIYSALRFTRNCPLCKKRVTKDKTIRIYI